MPSWLYPSPVVESSAMLTRNGFGRGVDLGFTLADLALLSLHHLARKKELTTACDRDWEIWVFFPFYTK